MGLKDPDMTDVAPRPVRILDQVREMNGAPLGVVRGIDGPYLKIERFGSYEEYVYRKSSNVVISFREKERK